MTSEVIESGRKFGGSKTVQVADLTEKHIGATAFFTIEDGRELGTIESIGPLAPGPSGCRSLRFRKLTNGNRYTVSILGSTDLMLLVSP